MVQPGNPDIAEPLTKSYLVELSVVAPQGQEQIQDDMKQFAEHLKPYPLLICLQERKISLEKKTLMVSWLTANHSCREYVLP